MLLDSFEFLIHVDDWIENQGEQVNRIKDTEFVAKLIFSSRNMKLLVTSSQNFEFPSLEKEKITQGAFKPEQTFHLPPKNLASCQIFTKQSKRNEGNIETP